MPNSSANRSAVSWLRDPTAATTPESVNDRSSAKVCAIPPVPRIPHRTGPSFMCASFRRSSPSALAAGRIEAYGGHGLLSPPGRLASPANLHGDDRLTDRCLPRTAAPGLAPRRVRGGGGLHSAA